MWLDVGVSSKMFMQRLPMSKKTVEVTWSAPKSTLLVLHLLWYDAETLPPDCFKKADLICWLLTNVIAMATRSRAIKNDRSDWHFFLIFISTATSKFKIYECFILLLFVFLQTVSISTPENTPVSFCWDTEDLDWCDLIMWRFQRTRLHDSNSSARLKQQSSIRLIKCCGINRKSDDILVILQWRLNSSWIKLLVRDSSLPGELLSSWVIEHKYSSRSTC